MEEDRRQKSLRQRELTGTKSSELKQTNESPMGGGELVELVREDRSLQSTRAGRATVRIPTLS